MDGENRGHHFASHHSTLATLSHAQGWHRNYAETIADSMFKRGLMQCTTPELGMVLESMRFQAERNRRAA